MQNIFDSHAHYDDPRFDEDRDTLLSSMASHGVRAIMNVGNTTHANLAGIELAKKYPFVYCSIGIHPDQSAEIAAQNSREYLDVIAQQLSYEKAMALGEIGLDYYYDDDAPRDIQKKIFEEQLALAKDLDVPIIIHNRDAHQDTLDLLKKYRPKGIMHCFSGSAEVAKEVLRLGMYIGFTGVITFKNARRAVEAAAEIPLDRLLVETDCPLSLNAGYVPLYSHFQWTLTGAFHSFPLSSLPLCTTSLEAFKKLLFLINDFLNMRL